MDNEILFSFHSQPVDDQLLTASNIISKSHNDPASDTAIVDAIGETLLDTPVKIDTQSNAIGGEDKYGNYRLSASNCNVSLDPMFTELANGNGALSHDLNAITASQIARALN